MRLVLVWRVTERCDTACGFCAYDARLRRPRREAEAAEVLRFGGLVARWARARGRRLLVAWLGGEPFLWRPLVAVTGALRALGAEIAVTTNGRALADERWRRFCLEAVDELTVSIDGPPAVHDALRGRPGAGEALLAALAALRAARQGSRPLLRVNSVVMRGTVEVYAELAERAVAAGADELTFNALGARDRPELAASRTLGSGDVARLRAEVVRLRAGGVTVRGGEAYLERLRATAEGQALPVADCVERDDFLFVEVDGRVAPCSYALDERGVAVADLATVDDLDALPRRLARTRARACDDCPSTQVHAKFEVAR